MDTIKYLLTFLVKLVFGLFLAAGVLWLVGFLYPSFKISNVLSGSLFSGDWLPTPKNYGGLLGTQTNDGMNGKEYVPGPAYNGYGNVTQTYPYGTGNVNDQVFTGDTSAYAEKSLYIRNLSVYEGGTISYGTSFVGEARDTMFANGSFPVAVIDRTGRVITSFQARNTGTWAAPGWIRFQASIPTTLPQGIDCALVFYSANQPTKVAMTVRCN